MLKEQRGCEGVFGLKKFCQSNCKISHRIYTIYMGLFLHNVYRLMSERGLTYEEACREVGKHGAQRRKAMRRRNAGKWISAEEAVTKVKNNRPVFPPAPDKDHHFEQAFLDFN